MTTFLGKNNNITGFAENFLINQKLGRFFETMQVFLDDVLGFIVSLLI